MTRCYLGLGSNLQSPIHQLQRAITALRQLPHSRLVGLSSIYFNAPVSLCAQPMFYNMVIALNTSLSPHRLYHYCQQIERRQGRVRKKKWGARVIDIDLLLYGQQTVHTHVLQIPHPYMLKRPFVLTPLLELAPELRLPSGDIIARTVSPNMATSKNATIHSRLRRYIPS